VVVAVVVVCCCCIQLGEIVNYMQIDTARLEYVTGSIHTLWDGLFQVRLFAV
jgi:hypothetical protein